MTVILVALPVVFQPELRRALEQIGRSRWLSKGGNELDDAEVNDVLNAVTNASVDMSRRKVGALMVFERNTGLEERIETGIAIDGILSEALLLNIFEKDTPLHDGAVIIRGNRIVAATCLLPLTENRNLSRELGTRHRAALGVTEQSDAIVVVVSEETGTISIARNGELMRYLHGDDVREILSDALFAKSNTAKDNLIGKVLGNLKNARGDKK
jgi:diadenylate cyclase